MIGKKKKSKKGKLPISLEDLVPTEDVRGSGPKQIFGILAQDDPDNLEPKTKKK